MIQTVVTYLREWAAIPREMKIHRPAVDSSGVVVEVGSGKAPHPKADLILDKYVADDFERPSGDAFSFTKPLVIADGHSLPLRDKSASFIIASHVLEHASDPALFAAEMSRVAGSGFAQVPAREAELTWGWPFHPWLIDLEGDTLVFHPRGDAKAPIGDVFHAQFAASPMLRFYWLAHRSLWHHSVNWRGSIEVRVEGESAAPASAAFSLDETVAILRQNNSPELTTDLKQMLVCPICHGDLEFDTEHASCANDAHVFPVVNGVPILVHEAAGRS